MTVNLTMNPTGIESFCTCKIL